MSRTLRLLVDPADATMVAALEVAARAGPLLVVTTRAWAQLTHELAGAEAALRWLAELATEVGQPIAVHLADPQQTMMLAPDGWGPERAAGWVAGRHAELEAALGPIARIRGLRGGEPS